MVDANGVLGMINMEVNMLLAEKDGRVCIKQASVWMWNTSVVLALLL